MEEDELTRRKLASALRKAEARGEEANKKVAEALSDPRASSKSGRARVRRHEKAAKKAQENYNRAERRVLEHEMGIVPSRPRRPRRF